jgi:hypothetical protein
MIAASFVRKGDDIREIRGILAENNAEHVQIYSKIENQEGVDNMDSILEVVDGIMVARGDLGVEVPAEDVPLIQKEIIAKWGNGYNELDYVWLENTYSDWVNKYKSDTLSEQKTFKLLTIKEFQIMKAIENNSNTDKLEETYLKLMSAGNVTPRDANASMDDENTKGLGVWTKDIEKYRPAEYFADKKLYKDFDSLVDYLNRFVFRPIKNFLMKTKEYDGEFSIEDDFKIGGDDK